MTALFGTGGKTSIALTANPALKVGLFGEKAEGWLVAILATTTETKNKVESGVLLDAVVLEGVSVLELLTGENETLLIWWDALLVLDLGFNVLDAIGWLNLKCDMLSSEGLHEDLHY